MENKQGLNLLTEAGFDSHPLWGYDEIKDVYLPICSFEEIPDESYKFFLRAEFITPSCIKLKGHLVGIKEHYCIVIFLNNYIFNKNLIDKSLQRINQLISEISSEKTKSIADIFPMK